MKIGEEVSVLCVHSIRGVCPWKIKWKNHIYTVTQLGLRYPSRAGRRLDHIFCISCGHITLRLRLRTDDLSWILEEIESE